MINELHIQNFQSHRKTDLIFDPGVNIIIGTSDSGKTAILRALKWLVWNRPSGNSFRSVWGGKTEVSAVTDDYEITRSKDKTDEYVLSTIDTPFKAFGLSVPEEISDALNLSDVNIQNQLDAPFLLSNTAGEVAAYFNKIAKLDSIDKATSNVNKWITDLSATIKYDEAQKVKQVENLATYDYLEKFEIELEVMEGMQGQAKGMKSKISDLSTLLSNIAETKTEIAIYKTTLDLEPKILEVLGLIEEKKTIEVNGSKLKNLVISLRYDTKEIAEYTKILSCEKTVNDLIALIDKRDQASITRSALSAIIEKVKSASKKIITADAEYANCLTVFEEAFPDICPLCDQSTKHLHHA